MFKLFPLLTLVGILNAAYIDDLLSSYGQSFASAPGGSAAGLGASSLYGPIISQPQTSSGDPSSFVPVGAPYGSILTQPQQPFGQQQQQYVQQQQPTFAQPPPQFGPGQMGGQPQYGPGQMGQIGQYGSGQLGPAQYGPGQLGQIGLAQFGPGQLGQLGQIGQAQYGPSQGAQLGPAQFGPGQFRIGAGSMGGIPQGLNLGFGGQQSPLGNYPPSSSIGLGIPTGISAISGYPPASIPQYQSFSLPPNNPCTRQALALNLYYHPDSTSPQKYIQCTQKGEPIERICSPGTLWNPFAVTCTRLETLIAYAKQTSAGIGSFF